MFSTELLIQTLISGLMIGVLYALMALGITFIYSIVRMINWAMGEFYMLGSYIQYVVVAYALGRDLWWLAVIISTAGTFLIGYLLEPILIKPMHARPMERRDDYATVVTIALLLMLRSLAVAIGGPYQYRPETNLPIMWVGPLPMEGARVAASVCALLALALFYLVISQAPGSGSRCAPPRRTAWRRRPPASTCSGSTRSRSRSASRSPGLPARCSRRCSWSIRPTAWSPP